MNSTIAQKFKSLTYQKKFSVIATFASKGSLTGQAGRNAGFFF